MELKLTFHSDPGHGWLELPKVIARGLGPAFCNSISFYSYQDRDNLYLEQDCDAPKALDALKAANFTVTHVVKDYNNEAPIRDYKRVNC